MNTNPNAVLAVHGPVERGRAKPAIRTAWLALCVALSLGSTALPARAQSEASAALSMLPVASVVVSAGAVGAVAALPVALSVGGATLSVVAVEAAIDGTVYVLERASDGARASIKVAGRALGAASVAVGATVGVTVIASGAVLSVAGAVLAFVPSALGRELLCNERLS